MRQILRIVSQFNLSVLANETSMVSLCREIDNFLAPLEHVLIMCCLRLFSGFSWESILFLKFACVNMVMQIQVQIDHSRNTITYQLFVCHSKILHKHCLQFLLGVKMAPRETENNVYAKFGVTNKEHYGMLWLPYFLEW